MESFVMYCNQLTSSESYKLFRIIQELHHISNIAACMTGAIFELPVLLMNYRLNSRLMESRHHS